MSINAFNKINQTHELFKKIIAPLKNTLGLSFGYMIVYRDGHYYQLLEDLECLKKFVLNVETSSIFCARNVTNCFDKEFNFTLWPNDPISPAMGIYKQHNIWNGITVSKTTKQYTELYWFTREEVGPDWHKFFIRNKQFLLDFIKYFENCRKDMHILHNDFQLQTLFKFKKDFDFNVLESQYVKEELQDINKAISQLSMSRLFMNKFKGEVNLSPREIEVLSILCKGFIYKTISSKLNISVKTVQHHIEHIKSKTGLHSKEELIDFYTKTLFPNV